VNHKRNWSNFDTLFGDRRRSDRRDTGDTYPAHLSFSRCRRSDDRRQAVPVRSRDWWLSTNYLDWEAGFHRLGTRRKPEA
jgi:hypothetical protein